MSPIAIVMRPATSPVAAATWAFCSHPPTTSCGAWSWLKPAEDERVQDDDVRHRHEGDESTADLAGDRRSAVRDREEAVEAGREAVPGCGVGLRGAHRTSLKGAGFPARHSFLTGISGGAARLDGVRLARRPLAFCGPGLVLDGRVNNVSTERASSPPSASCCSRSATTPTARNSHGRPPAWPSPRRVLLRHRHRRGGDRAGRHRARRTGGPRPARHRAGREVPLRLRAPPPPVPRRGPPGLRAGGRLIGLGTLARVLDAVASRPQLQERLGEQVATTIADGLAAAGVLVVLDAQHQCVTTLANARPDRRPSPSRRRGASRTPPAGPRRSP